MNIVEKLKDAENEFLAAKVPIIGPKKGEALLSLIRKHSPKRILELGTAGGYSGVVLGSEGAELVTIDRDSVWLEKAEELFMWFDISATIFLGDGIEVLQKLCDVDVKKFDFAFIDFEKKKTLEAFELVQELLSVGGTIVIDNITNPKCAKQISQIESEYKTTRRIDVGDGMLVVHL